MHDLDWQPNVNGGDNVGVGVGDFDQTKYNAIINKCQIITLIIIYKTK